MAGVITDLIDRVSDSSTGRPVIATLAAPGKAIAAASINLDAATNWTTSSAIHFSIYETVTVGSVTVKDASTQTDWKGTLAGVAVGNLTLTGGTDRAYTAGAKVELTPTSRYGKDIYDWAMSQHNQNGTHAAVTATSLTSSNGLTVSAGAVSLPAGSLETADYADKSVTSRKTALTMIGADGTTVNPLPITRNDIPSSSITFTCDVASYLDMTVSADVQVNANATAYVTPYVDGVATSRELILTNASGSQMINTLSRRYRIPLTAGSHTIKLTTLTGVATNAVVSSPSWWGVLIAQP